ncbi:TetR/AcrR family transcriptional regulator [Halothermothrix orenii]|uniref:Transcriptional regulator, TetR family n=1 Tax=Halothermothrix orenii (strain H 168 / OCM 544 / DSM 9562) TaxID=373903 RepID=B8D268_HALOH|nr:TetR/AcrR family transcriptional regulator [Halothermothrix orenii]ACL69295.1 transcriptional regulator, TetR family [Halothermothrix orenii H 168]
MSKSEETKKKILKSAIELVADKGYASTSTREIAKNAGVSEATIFKYYKNKDQLLKKIVSKTINDFFKYSLNKSLPEVFEANKNKSIDYLLQELLTERFQFFKENSKAIQVIFQETMVNKEVREFFKNKVWTKMDELETSIIIKGKKQGLIRNIDNYFIKKALFGMIFYTVFFEEVLELDNKNKYNSEEQARAILDIIFKGIKNDK